MRNCFRSRNNIPSIPPAPRHGQLLFLSHFFLAFCLRVGMQCRYLTRTRYATTVFRTCRAHRASERASERSELQSAPCSTEEWNDTDSTVGRGEGGRMHVRAAFSYKRHVFALEQIYPTLFFLRNVCTKHILSCNSTRLSIMNYVTIFIIAIIISVIEGL